MPPQEPDNASTKSKSSFKSLAIKASKTIKNIKHKAPELLSPKRKKKVRCLPGGESDVDPMDTDDPELQPSLSNSTHSHHSNGSVIDIDDNNSDDELSK